MVTRFILIIAIFQLAIWDCYAVNGVIWRKQQQEFVQLFSIPEFAALQKENLAEQKNLHSIRGKVVKAAYFEVRMCVLKRSTYSISSARYRDNLSKNLTGEFWANPQF